MSDILDSYLKKILNSRVYEVAHQTPLQRAPLLSEKTGNRIWFKREDQQSIFSFKLRGAHQKITSLSHEQRAEGVVAASAGNHAQGVALSASRLGLRSVIVMPRTTPNIKVRAVSRLGAEVQLHGDSYPEALDYALNLAGKNGLAFIHPYDDPEVIAGQGTIGLELLSQIKTSENLDAVFVPVGGGGLVAGIGACLKSLRPDIRVIGVEVEDSACLSKALEDGERTVLPEVGLFADGVAVAQVGEECFRLAQLCVDEMVQVETDEICASVKAIFEETRSLMEPAGALAVAGMVKWAKAGNVRGQNLAAILSGANGAFHRLRHISERTQWGEGQEAVFAARIPERPGSFLKFCLALGPRRITEFNYRFGNPQTASVFAAVEISQPEERADVLQLLVRAGFGVEDLTDNTIAQTHVRHMVGGPNISQIDEVIVSFTFPERPRALENFLKAIGDHWNISLFHHRNHGTAHGRVLAGFQVPFHQRQAFFQRLKYLGYGFREETANPAYQRFLAPIKACLEEVS